MNNKFNIILLFSGLLFFSCGENVIEEPDPNLFGYDYFPVEVGYVWEYEVDSVLIIAGGGANNIVTKSFIREEIVELVSEIEDERVYNLERSYRASEDEEWVLEDIWQVSVDSEIAVKTEENLSFIKLVFPAQAGEKWDGNAFFDSTKEFSVAANKIAIFKDWRYKIEATDLERTYNDMTYTDVLQVSHIDEESFINKRYSEEFYVKGIGLVERNMEIFNTQNDNESLEWLEKAEAGFQLNQRLISFSKN